MLMLDLYRKRFFPGLFLSLLSLIVVACASKEDSSNNIAIDETPPVIILIGDDPMSVWQGTTYEEPVCRYEESHKKERGEAQYLHRPRQYQPFAFRAKGFESLVPNAQSLVTSEREGFPDKPLPGRRA